MSSMRVFAIALLAMPLLAQHGLYLNDSQHPAIGQPEAIAAGGKLFGGSCAAYWPGDRGTFFFLSVYCTRAYSPGSRSAVGHIL